MKNIKIPHFLKNKYVLVSLAALVWLSFFDNNNFFQQYRLKKQLNQLHRDKAYYEQEIMKDSTAVVEIRNNPGALEKLAREKYLMKKDNEDIYIIKTE